jgi:solute carrier family 35 protein E3
MLPLATAMTLNVIMPNLSLQYSSVTFYQIARILLTPCVALLNYMIAGKVIPTAAAVALIPACFGVGIVTYFDRLPAPGAEVKTTSLLGVIFAFAGIFFSSIYTVFIAKYHKSLQLSSMQLLLNQAPVSVFILLYVIPFSDDVTVWQRTELNTWLMIFLVSEILSFLFSLDGY